jgi:hypothetical protein
MMKPVVALVMLLAACAPERRKECVLLDAHGVAATLCIRDDIGGALLAKELRRLLMAAWDDGTVVWRPDPEVIEMHCARVDPARVAEVRDQIFANVRSVAPDRRRYTFPDTTITWIDARHVGETLTLASAHEHFEDDPRLVALDRGITTVDARGREVMLAECAPDYLAFRDAWSRTRASAASLVPAEGTPCSVSDYRFEWR